VPTYEETEQFWRDYERLSPAQRAAFRRAVRRFVEDLKRGPFRKGLRVKAYQHVPGLWEMTWAPDGRALFEYGPEKRPGEKHVIWRRIGTHAILE
jgi:hypothetical protein